MLPPQPKTPQRRLTYQERARIHTLYHNAGWSYKDIAKETGIKYNTVRHCAQSRLTPQKQAGRRPILNTPLRQRLFSHATANREQRQKPLQQVTDELGLKLDLRTIQKA